MESLWSRMALVAALTCLSFGLSWLIIPTEPPPIEQVSVSALEDVKPWRLYFQGITVYEAVVEPQRFRSRAHGIDVPLGTQEALYRGFFKESQCEVRVSVEPARKQIILRVP